MCYVWMFIDVLFTIAKSEQPKRPISGRKDEARVACPCKGILDSNDINELELHASESQN
jgi:hypothetical protein